MYKNPQPIKLVLFARGLSTVEVARHVHRNAQYVGRVVNGHEVGGPALRAALAKLLDLPESELFRPGK